MKTVTIYGASDDLIELEGDINEEFYCREYNFLHFNEGSIIGIGYSNDGVWQIKLVKPGIAKFEITSKGSPDDDYTDRATLTGDIASVECWQSADGPTREELEEKLIDINWGDYPEDILREVYQIIIK